MIKYHNVRDAQGRFASKSKQTVTKRKPKNYQRGTVQVGNKTIYQVLILDESGSMAERGKDKALVSAYNENIQDLNNLQKKIIKQGTKILCSTYSFNSLITSRTHGCSIEQMNQLVLHQNYTPNGGTALVSAICKAIDDMRTLLGSAINWFVGKERDVVITVYTDGEENMSLIVDKLRIKGLIEEMEKVYGWTFAFMGAGTKENVQVYADVIGMGTNVFASADNAIGVITANTTYMNSRNAKAVAYSKTGTTSNIGFFSNED